MTAISLEALAAVPWDRFESLYPPVPVQRVPEVLRRIALGEAEEGDEQAVHLCLANGRDRVTEAATEALPFLVALAADPGTGTVRLWLVELLAGLVRTAGTAAPARVHGGWADAWERHRPTTLVLLHHRDAEVRRCALPLGGVAPLLERWRTETEPSIRLNVLWALGRAAAAEAERGTLAEETAEEVREVLTGVVRDGSPALRIAALEAWADFDPDVLARQSGLLVEIFAGGDVEETQRDFARLYYLPEAEAFLSRERGLFGIMLRFSATPRAAISFVARLAEATARTGDTLLLRAALETAWDLLVAHRSVEPGLLPLAGALLTHPDPGTRIWAAHLLAVLGAPAEPYADRLAALLDDHGEDELIEGTVANQARWALTRIGDPRGLPGLVEQLYEPPYRAHYGEGYVEEAPRLPEIDDVLVPLREHADLLLPAVREVMRWQAEEYESWGGLTGRLLRVLEAWGEKALPALPEVVALLGSAHDSLSAVDVLVAMGQGAASAEDVVRGCTVLDWPPNHLKVEYSARLIGGRHHSALQLLGETLTASEGPHHGFALCRLAGHGPAAAPYTARVRELLDRSDGGTRLDAAITLWSITGEAEPSASVLEEFVLPVAEGDDTWGSFRRALRALARIGRITPEARAALHTVRDFDRRLTPGRDYVDLLADEETRAAIEEVLALP
ncbi:hypothetical protein ACFYPN_11235 [Streptomyces sp. NPDC005576]|uniref:hypothetical protein n=1 Tax=unclassified Streptomyces TaxID=2593676 RepID=UPI0033F2876C